MPVSRRSALTTIGAAGGLTALGATALASGNHTDDEETADDEETPAEEESSNGDGSAEPAAIRIAHFSPDAPAIDVLIDGDLVVGNFSYGDVSPYLEVAAGTYQVTITAAGDPETVVFDDEIDVESAFYTVAAIGELEDETFEPVVLVDAGAALVRLFHAAPDAPAVDVLVDGEPLFENVAFCESTDYVPVPAGSYELSITPADTPDTVVATFDVDVELGGAYTANAIGYLEPPEDASDAEFSLKITVDREPTDDGIDVESPENGMDDGTDEEMDDEDTDNGTDDEMNETDGEMDDDAMVDNGTDDGMNETDDEMDETDDEMDETDDMNETDAGNGMNGGC